MSVQSHLDPNMEDILRKLVAFPTVTGDATAMHQLLSYVAGFVSERGMHVAWYESGGYPSIVATIKPDQRRPKVMLAAHADVVPAGPEMFKLRTEADRYIGRGVLDMKFALAAYLQLVDDLQDDLQAFDFGIMVTADEELGGRHGTAKLVDEGYLPDVCVMPDGGENWQVQTASKGSCVYGISATGQTAHGSRPWLGDNALLRLIGVLDEISALFPRSPSSDTNTITLSKMRGGEASNQVPGRAHMVLDVRTLDAAEYHRVNDAILAICRHNQVDCDVLLEVAPTMFSLDEPHIAAFARLIEQNTGIEVIGSRTNGSNDARWYVPYGVPCISLYPKGGDLHADSEWLDRQAFGQFHDILLAYVRQIAATKPVQAVGRY